MLKSTELPTPADRALSPTRLWLEVAAIVLLGVIPDILNAVMLFLISESAARVFWIDAVILIQRSVTVCAVTLLVMWLSGEGWKRFGMQKWEWRVDPFLCLLLLIAGWVVSGIVLSAAYFVLPAWQPVASEFVPPASAVDLAMLVLMCIANGFCEELVIWAFLFTRLAVLLRSAPLAIFICAAMFASYHVYQGFAAMSAIMALGLLHGLFFWRTRRLWPLVMAHATWDILAYLQ